MTDRMAPAEVRRMATSDLIMLVGAAAARADVNGGTAVDDLGGEILAAACAELDRRLPQGPSSEAGLIARLDPGPRRA